MCVGALRARQRACEVGWTVGTAFALALGFFRQRRNCGPEHPSDNNNPSESILINADSRCIGFARHVVLLLQTLSAVWSVRYRWQGNRCFEKKTCRLSATLRKEVIVIIVRWCLNYSLPRPVIVRRLLPRIVTSKCACEVLCGSFFFFHRV